MYICRFCQKEFEDQRPYAAHIANHVQSEMWSKTILDKQCEKCNKIFQVTRSVNPKGKILPKKSERRFCKECSNKRVLTEESKKKISEKLKGRTSIRNTDVPLKFCKCGKQLKRKNKSGYCSNCLPSAPEYKDSRIEAGKKSYQTKLENGTHLGWASRNIRSYAERFFERVLKNLNIFQFCQTEKMMSANEHRYFLDFYFEDIKLDLEIDGKQHEYEDRQKHDEERDRNLKGSGILVYRIPWRSINTDEGKEYIRSEINKFKEYYNSLHIKKEKTPK